MAPFLKPGKNQVTFHLEPDSKTFLTSYIFVYEPDTKLIISDVDGTITKSDMLGHILPRIKASHWAQRGVAEFYS